MTRTKRISGMFLKMNPCHLSYIIFRLEKLFFNRNSRIFLLEEPLSLFLHLILRFEKKIFLPQDVVD